jgi:two-component system nitrate/nitrite sensor histidine kinase NarX
MKSSHKLFERSLLVRLGTAMAAIALLALLGLATSAIVAETTQGHAAAINVSGSLRMQSYRLVSLALLAGRGHSQEAALAAALDRFEHDLNSSAITRVLPGWESHPLRAAHRDIVAQWRAQLRPPLEAILKGALPTPNEGVLLDITAGFVAELDEFVGRLERATEAKIDLLRITLGIALFLTLGVVFITLYLVHTDVLIPLRDLLDTAASIGRGNLRARTQQTGQDELGVLGQTLNQMAEDLSRSYQELEHRVQKKTADLERSNRSLELLYHSIARLYNGPVTPETYRILLKDVESVLGVGHGSVCLIEQEEAQRGRLLASTLDPSHGDIDLCAVSTCEECLARGETLQRLLPGQHDKKVLALPLRDMERQYGVLQLELPVDHDLAPWQMQLLEALSKHIGTALSTAHRIEQKHLLTVMEERAVIARELHDSLAQSLSYMKIQVSRLQALLAKSPSGKEADRVIAELRDGLSSAYRQLRELLTTFRLKLGGLGLSQTLQKTAQEFAERGEIPIELETHLAGVRLTPNQEIHVLQIVREALANVIHHAQASRARVVVEGSPEGMVSASIEDDGIGIGRKPEALHHHGFTIMEERARSLGGTLAIQNRALGCTRVLLRFPADPRSVPPAKLNPIAAAMGRAGDTGQSRYVSVLPKSRRER